MKVKSFALLSIFLFMIIFLSGCFAASASSSRGKDVSGGPIIDVASMLRFDDVPVPSGFKVLDSESFAFQNDETRVALLKYKGTQVVDAVVGFYSTQMPIYNWSPINIIEYERRILNYEKGAESCIVTLEPEGRATVITIAISPKSRPMKPAQEK